MTQAGDITHPPSPFRRYSEILPHCYTGQVVFRPIAGNVPSIALLMAWKKGEMKPALRDFIAIVQERLASVTA